VLQIAQGFAYLQCADSAFVLLEIHNVYIQAHYKVENRTVRPSLLTKTNTKITKQIETLSI